MQLGQDNVNISGAAEGRSVWGGSQVPTSFITMSCIYSTVQYMELVAS